MLIQNIVKRFFFVGVVILSITWLSACGGIKTGLAPTSTRLIEPSATHSPQASPSSTRAATSTVIQLPSATLTLVPPSATPTPAPLAARLPIIEYHYSDFKLSDQVMMKPEWFKEQLR